MSSTQTKRSQIKSDILTMLGDDMVEVELDPRHLDLAVTLAVDKLRQRSDGAVEEKFLFLQVQPEKNEYTLPSEVQEVRKLYRRGVGANSTGGTNFDPFEAAFSNIYLLQAGRTGGLATWDFFSEYQEVIGRVFGSEVNFIWEHSARKLTLIRKFEAEEDIMVHAYVSKNEEAILLDPYMGPWARDYAMARAKFMLGEARGKFTTGLPGPDGNVVLNGEQLKNEAVTELTRLEEDLENFVTQSNGMPFTIG